MKFESLTTGTDLRLIRAKIGLITKRERIKLIKIQQFPTSKIIQKNL